VKRPFPGDRGPHVGGSCDFTGRGVHAVGHGPLVAIIKPGRPDPQL